MAQPNVQVLGRNLITWWRNIWLRQKHLLLLEDFGIGRGSSLWHTVIAYGAGGALETVRDISQHRSLEPVYFLGRKHQRP